MKIIDGLEQGSEKWLEFRESHLGASDSAAILGLSPYNSAKGTWQSKTDRSFGVKENYAMREGTRNEIIIRERYEEFVGLKYTTPTAEHGDYPFISASCDGYNADTGKIIEIKHSQHSKLSDVIRTDCIDIFKKAYPHYFSQCQHLMLVFGASKCPVVTVSPDDELLYTKIKRDDEFIEGTLLPGLIDFWNDYVLKDVEPPLGELDILYVDTQEGCELAMEWLVVNKELKALQAREKKLRAEICDIGDDGDFNLSGLVKVTRVQKAGSVDTKKLYDAYDIKKEDLEKYRKEQIGYYQIRKI